MRDINRISMLCNAIACQWINYFPDWRFGQLIVNFLSWLGKDPFYMEDEDFYEKFTQFVEAVQDRQGFYVSCIEEIASVEQKTFYEAANNLNMQVGSYLRIPVSMQTSRETAPSVTVTEITDDGKRNLSMLYYDAVQGAVIIMPADVGEGRIRLADVNTNSIYDICYTVVGEGLAINIYEDNGIFTWLDSSKRDGDTGRDAWEFKTDIMQWSNSNTALPYRHDLAQADAGEAFTFRTLASSIDLYFMGEGNNEAEISVSKSVYSAISFPSSVSRLPVARTFMPSALAIFPVVLPIRPKPMIPIVFPASSIRG